MNNKYLYFAYGFFMGNMAVALGLLFTKLLPLIYLAVLFVSSLILVFLESREND